MLHGRITENRLRTSVEIHKDIPETRHLKFDRIFTIKEDNRQKCVFIVVLIKWSIKNYYPLGAVLAVKCSDSIEEAMVLLRLQYHLPKWSACPLDETNLPQSQRVFKTSPQVVFTIGEPEETYFNFGINISQRYSNGSTRIGVHVTDISGEVQKDHIMDDEAKARGFSFHSYSSDENHSMSPEQIKTMCNLVEGQKRQTLFVFVVVNNNGYIVHETLSKTVSQSTKHYTYSEAEHIIENMDKYDFDDADIRILHSKTEKLWNKRIGSAALSIDAKIDFSTVDCFMTSIKSRKMIDEI